MDNNENDILSCVHSQLKQVRELQSKSGIYIINGEGLTINLDDKISLVYGYKKTLLLKINWYNWFVCINNNPVIQDSAFSSKFLVSYQKITTREFANEIAEKISANMDKIEKYFFDKANELYGLE